MSDNKKLSLIVFNGNFDNAVAAFTLASGAAASGYDVKMFFTFWGLNVIKKKRGRAFIGRGILARIFGFLQGGRKNLPLSRLNFLGVSPKLMTSMMKKRNVATLEELLQASIELGVEFYACEMSMHILGLKKEDFILQVKKVLGVPGFLDLSDGGEVLFI
ncbi:DsrE/DsrF/DrsH-like family protein [Spirochaetia bacterium 38H-sp]|uniref:DsrE/DsrF/DrsH-like family protein n=1 Tax=Rarispira pelagica TaxID=3141764 RepID=A0ABU9U9T1_9SPIR